MQLLQVIRKDRDLCVEVFEIHRVQPCIHQTSQDMDDPLRAGPYLPSGQLSINLLRLLFGYEGYHVLQGHLSTVRKPDAADKQ